MIRVLLADDEAPARRRLRRLLAEAGAADVDVVAEAEDGEAALEAIAELAPDLVFLDVQMPKLDGFGVVAAVGAARMPYTIFVTAHDDYALRAFEARALDYLLKPVSAERFAAALEHARERLADRRDFAERVAALGAPPAPARWRSRILAERDERTHVLAVGGIDRIEADGNYLCLHAAGQRYTLRGTLGDLEHELDPDVFVRLNRSTLVRIDAIRHMEPWFHGDYHVTLKDGTTLTWSRRYRARSALR